MSAGHSQVNQQVTWCLVLPGEDQEPAYHPPTQNHSQFLTQMLTFTLTKLPCENELTARDLPGWGNITCDMCETHVLLGLHVLKLQTHWTGKHQHTVFPDRELNRVHMAIRAIS